MIMHCICSRWHCFISGTYFDPGSLVCCSRKHNSGLKQSFQSSRAITRDSIIWWSFLPPQLARRTAAAHACHVILWLYWIVLVLPGLIYAIAYDRVPKTICSRNPDFHLLERICCPVETCSSEVELPKDIRITRRKEICASFWKILEASPKIVPIYITIVEALRLTSQYRFNNPLVTRCY